VKTPNLYSEGAEIKKGEGKLGTAIFKRDLFLAFGE